MNARFKKIVLLLLAAALLFSSGQFQKSMNSDRAKLGLTYNNVLDDAPPVLAFTTVALGGFRGLISNYLWMRANDLQQDDKFFEAAQLADWITDLEPHFPQVWIFEAWNMAFNISIKFKDPPDRWRWIERGIALLRDQGLRYNPDAILIYQQLAWFFQFKIGQNLDDANLYYKQQWAEEMMPFFGPNGTNFATMIDPVTAAEKTNAMLLREKFKVDPVFAQKVDELYGPLDWRLPEAQAIYWAACGLDYAKKNPDKVKKDDLIQLRRVIYQSMQQAFRHGQLVMNPFSGTYELYPNLNIISKLNDISEQMIRDDAIDQGNIKTFHRNFLKDAVYYLYQNNRVDEAAKWYRILGEKYPDQWILDGVKNSFPRNLTLDQYAVGRVQEDIGETSQDRVTAVVEGLLVHAYEELAIGSEDRYDGFKLLAGKVYQHFESKISSLKDTTQRIGLPPYADMNRNVLNELLDPQQGLPFAARAIIRTQLGMSAETNAPVAVSTNLPPISATNAVENVPTNSAAK